MGERLRDWFSGIAERLDPYRQAVAPVVEHVRAVLGSVSALGWAVVVGCAVAWYVAAILGWREFAVLAAVLLVLFVIACLFTIGRQSLEVSLDVDPIRVKVGESAAARIRVRNVARTPLLPLALEFPVGTSLARFTLPTLAAQQQHDELLVIPTQRRGVIEVGPVLTQRGDPFGMVRREVTWVDRQEMFVHPKTVGLEPVGFGLLRDLEGHTTNNVSMSDLAFHTLREYAPGDDRRYIHWRSSAKLSSTTSSGKFLVRQFLDTRRSHIAVVVDANREAYASPEEFELAISAGASISLRTLLDEMDLTIVCGDHAVDNPPAYAALDTFSRADFGDWDLPRETGRLNRIAPDASVVVFVSGSRLPFAVFQQSRAYLPPEVHAFAISVEEGVEMSLRDAGNLTVLAIGELNDLPRVLSGVQLQ